MWEKNPMELNPADESPGYHPFTRVCLHRCSSAKVHTDGSGAKVHTSTRREMTLGPVWSLVLLSTFFSFLPRVSYITQLSSLGKGLKQMLRGQNYRPERTFLPSPFPPPAILAAS